jgi:hypothetical protein
LIGTKVGTGFTFAVGSAAFGAANTAARLAVRIPQLQKKKGLLARKCESSAMDYRLEKLKENLESAVEGMSSEQMSWHLPGKWCAAEVLEHLYLSYAATIKGLEEVITSGKPLATRASMAQRVLTFVVVGLGQMPGRRKAPAVAQPRGLPAEQVRNEIGAKMAAMDAIIAHCEAHFGPHVKLRNHPILGPLTAPGWRKLHLVHGRHHQKQLLRLRESTTRQMG